ncbi:membrane protease YdiL (CAAX protease family) [Nakamurella sp. UYEF19]|uniref:CPBP family intramembrane glutamic endopeptidase n=1 Tax=Nakamurella sp. UYEF19 TaxID=1756392 RepID=UPI003399BBDC
MGRINDLTQRGRALVDQLPTWMTQKVPRDHRESDAAFAHRRRVVAAVSVTGTGFLGAALSTKPNSRAFYVSTFGVAATWTAGAFASGPLHLGRMRSHHQNLKRPVLAPVLAGVGAFGVFYAAALVARRIPVLDRGLRHVLQFAEQGSTPLVVLTTVLNGAAEELFFRGALFAAVGQQYPVRISTALYLAATCATRNPALVLAAGVMGSLFGWQRRATGGVQAPIITHAVWSSLMLRFLPPLFRAEATSLTRRASPHST